MDLIQRLAFSVLRYPEREFLVDGALRLTFAEWDRAVNRAARGYRELGVRRQDHVVLALRNRGELITSWYGLMKLGAIATPINYRFSPGEIVYCVKDAGAKVFVFEDFSRESGMKAAGDFPKGCRTVFCDADPPEGVRPFPRLSKPRRTVRRGSRLPKTSSASCFTPPARPVGPRVSPVSTGHRTQAPWPRPSSAAISWGNGPWGSCRSTT